MLDVALPGTGGMMPLPGRFLASLLLRYNGRLILVDCGEGTQVSLKMLSWGFKNIDIICITHHHADHISGLPGILLTIGNAGRTEPLTILGPPGTKKVVNALRMIAPELPFEIQYVEHCKETNTMYQDTVLKIDAMELNHRIPCLGYRFTIRRKGMFMVEKAKANNVPKQIWSQLQKNGSVEYKGEHYSDALVLGPERKGLKVSYVTDTRPVEDIVPFIEGSDLFICEGMYGEDEKKEKAVAYRHMVYSEAAALAKKGRVSELWLTHFSPSMMHPEDFLQNVQAVFPSAVVGFDRMSKNLLFKNNNDIL